MAATSRPSGIIESVAAAINLRVHAGTIILNQDVGLIVSDGGVQLHYLSVRSGSGIIAPEEQ